MEWSTGLDEDAAESSETLEERSMKKCEVVSLSSFASSSSSSSSDSSLVTNFFCQHNTYMYYYLYVLVLSCILRIHFLLFRESKGESSSSRKNKFNSQPLRSSLSFIACSIHHCQQQGWRHPVTEKSSSVFNTSVKTTEPCDSTSLHYQHGKEPLPQTFSTRKSCSAVAAAKGVGARHLKQQQLLSQEQKQQPEPSSSSSLAPGSVSIFQSPQPEQVSLARPKTTQTGSVASLSARCRTCHFGLSKHHTNITTSNRHHFRKGEQGLRFMTSVGVAVGGGIPVDSSRKPCQRIIKSAGEDNQEAARMPGEEEARVGLSSALLATTALTTTTTTSSSSAAASSVGGSGTSSTASSSAIASSSSSSLTPASSSLTGIPKVPLPTLSYQGRGVPSASGLLSGLGGGGNSGGLAAYNTGATTTLTPIVIASCPPGNSNTVTTVNNNFTTGATTTTNTPAGGHGAGIIGNINNTIAPGNTVDGGVLSNNHQKKQQQQLQSFQSNPLPAAVGSSGARPVPLLANLNSGNNGCGPSTGLVNSYNKQQHHPLHHHQYQQQPQLSLKPIIATPNGNPSSASLAETNKRDTGTCNGHGTHPPSRHGGGGGGVLDDDEIDDAGDSSKLELQLQFAGIDNETAVDVDVEDEENNYEAGESGPMYTVVPTSKRNGNGGGGAGGGGSSSNGGEKSGGGRGGVNPTSSFPAGGDVPGGGTMVVAPSATAAGSAAATSTTSSTTLGGGASGAGAAGPTNSLGAAAGTTTAGGVGAAGSTLGDEEDDEDEEEDVEGGKTVECTEVVVPDQTFAEKCLFYTTAFFILLAVFSLFAFLFLVPFVIDPAFTTIFMEFDPEPAFCQTVSYEQKEGLSNCSWTSCREGCTREVYQCKQIKVNYRIARRRSRSDSVDFQDKSEQQPQQLRRPNSNKNLISNNNNVNNFINNNYHGGSSSSSQLALSSSDLRRLSSSEHSGSSFNTPFNNLNNNLLNNNGYGGGIIMNTYHSSASGSGGDAGSLRDASSSKHSKPSHYKNLLINSLHHSSKYSSANSASGGDVSAASLISHMNSASAVRSSGVVMNLKSSKHNRMASQQLKSTPSSSAAEEPFWDFFNAHLYPNVKGCGYPPVVVCSDFVEKYGKEGANFSCFYSKVDRALVVTNYEMSRVIMDLVYSMAIPIPSFIISVVYLIFAYFRIYNTEASSSNHETGGGGRAGRLNSSSTTTNLQNPGSANRGGGGSSADDPDAETSISVDDKTCIIQRSTSRGLNALSDKLPNSGKGLHAQVIEMNDLNPQLRHPVDGDVFLPQKRNNNCSNNPANPAERNGPTNPAAKNKGEETTEHEPKVEAS